MRPGQRELQLEQQQQQAGGQLLQLRLKAVAILAILQPLLLIFKLNIDLGPVSSSGPLLSPAAATRPNAMWDDEDNNPYGSFHRRDSETSDIASPTERESPSLYDKLCCELTALLI